MESAMNLTDAMEQLDAIHTHLARDRSYHGYRPLALALSGLAGLAAALVQPWWVSSEEPVAFVRYWVVVAAGCAALAGSATLLGYFTREDAFLRRRTRTVFGQFAPCLFAGAVLTFGLAREGESAIGYLPGAWALIYGLGIVASLPYLPRLAGLIAAWYLGWGLVLLTLLDASAPASWTVGVPFGVGQLLSAFVLVQARTEVQP
jgi:hypothetical protein